jgi:hypothetical protein
MKVESDGKVKSIYCHNDGYPSYVGWLLLDHYKDEKALDGLIALGGLSRLTEKMAPDNPDKHSFDEPEDGAVVAYHRDRKDKLYIEGYDTLEEALAEFKESYNDYAYVWREGKWYYSSRGDKALKLLSYDVCRHDANKMKRKFKSGKTKPVTALWAVGSDVGDNTREIHTDFFSAFGIKPEEQLKPEFQIELPDDRLLKCVWDGSCAEIVDDKLTLKRGCCFTIIEVCKVIIEGNSYPCLHSKCEDEKFRLSDLISLECYVGEPINGIRLFSKVLAKYPDVMELDPYPYYRRGDALMTEGIFPEAVINFTNAIRVATATGGETWLYYYYRACAKYFLNDMKGLREDIAECCRQGYALDAGLFADNAVEELGAAINDAIDEIGASDSYSVYSETRPDADTGVPVKIFRRGFPVSDPGSNSESEKQ